MVPGEVCAERSERSNHNRKIVLNVQKSAEVIVAGKKKAKDRISRSSKYDRERRSGR